MEHFLGKEEVIGSNPIVGSRQEMGNPAGGKSNVIVVERDTENQQGGLSHVEAEV